MRQLLNKKSLKQIEDFIKVDINNYFLYISQTIKEIIKDLPYSRDLVLMHNLYLSIMLTFIN